MIAHIGHAGDDGELERQDALAVPSWSGTRLPYPEEDRAPAPRWSGPAAPESAADPRAVTLETMARLLEPMALDVPLLLDPEATGPDHGSLDALPCGFVTELLALSRRAAVLLDDARKTLATRDTEPGGEA